jgi:uncharacterized protein (TIGR02145 family)
MRTKSLIFVLIVAVVFICVAMTDSNAEYVCGDANSDGAINVSDAVYLINYIFIVGSPAPDPDCCEFGGASLILIDASPDSINAPWVLTGPDGYCASGNGDGFAANLYGGDYMMTWGEISGWTAPPICIQTLLDTAIMTFIGTYHDENTTGTVTDIDGNVYQTIKIGDQWWMAENLKVTHYRNGDPILNVTDNGDWNSLSSGAYCDYNNDPANVAMYGRLYNWFAVAEDFGVGIAPAGWHVALDDDWILLEYYLGMSIDDFLVEGWRGTDEGGKLKEAGTAHWNSPNTGATNESGFTALPGGIRHQDGTFAFMADRAWFWTLTEDDFFVTAWARILTYDRSDDYRGWYPCKAGFSVRCVKDQ